jgi:hypothetical protein
MPVASSSHDKQAEYLDEVHDFVEVMPDQGMLSIKDKNRNQDMDLLSYCRASMRSMSQGTSINS